MMNYLKLILTLFFGLLPWNLQAADLFIRPGGMTTGDIFFADTASSYPNPNVAFMVKTSLSCYGTNLRSVSNPISPSSAVQMAVDLSNGHTFNIIFPGYLVAENRSDHQVVNDIVTYLDGVRNAFPASGVRNTITFAIPSSADPGVSFSGSAQNYDISQRTSLIQRISFVQDMISDGAGSTPRNLAMNAPVEDWPIQRALKNLMRPFQVFQSTMDSSFAGGGGFGGPGGDGALPGGGDWELTKLDREDDFGWGQPRWQAPANLKSALYMGNDGPLTGNWEATWSSDFKTLNINASFPGENGFCGGYFSPLMLFFNEKRPDFTEYINFRMSSFSEKSYWPEVKSEGYFLALDRNEDGIINDISELFGSEDNNSNGFEILRAFDENNDGLINQKDPIFNHLVLWKDSTGKGITLKKDLKSLNAMGVKEIQLGYTLPYVVRKGQRAEERERAGFTFIKSGKILEGEIIDVWLGTN